MNKSLSPLEKHNLLDLIKDSTEVREEMESNEEYKKIITKQIGYVNQDIEKAKNENRSDTCFVVASDYESDVKRLFIEKGYRFKPTGMCGGVWQNSENICW